MTPETVRVLIVDDSEDDALLARRMLAAAKRAVFNVDWEPSFAEGVRRAATDAYDAGLIDYYLDERDGLQLIRQAGEAGCQTPIIVLTSLGDTDMDLRAIQEGADDYLVKGQLDADLLERVILQAIERRRARKHTTELAEAVTALQREVAQRTEAEQQLREAVVKLEKHNRERSEFVANVSHELKTPLTSMMYGTRNLLRGIAGPLPGEAVRYLEMFDSECQRLVNTISDILDMGKLDNQSLTPSPVVVPLARLIHRSVDAIRVQFEAARLSFDVSFADGTRFVRCDPGMIFRVIHNVLSNAIKFTPAGGKIRIAAGPDPSEANRARITVRDTGIGIPPESLQRVTERYFRAGNHATGSGLGLAISKEIVALHGGTLRIASPAPGQTNGTEASLSLPLAKAPRILVVDDDEAIQRLLTEYLTGCGYAVDTCAEGCEGLRRIEAGNVDAVILDMILKDMHGREVILALKQSAKVRYLPILAVTAGAVDEGTLDILTRFGIPALPKPWPQGALLDAIENALIGMTAFHWIGGGKET